MSKRLRAAARASRRFGAGTGVDVRGDFVCGKKFGPFICPVSRIRSEAFGRSLSSLALSVSGTCFGSFSM